jgi:hypothetical protein
MQDEMYNKSNFETLSAIAKETGRRIEYDEVPYKSSRAERFPKYRATAFIPFDSNESIYYVCFWDSFERIAENTVYSGVFMPVSLPQTLKFTIREKNIIDKFNKLFGNKSYKTGNGNFDGKTEIRTNDPSRISKILHDTKIQKLILESMTINHTIKVSLNEIQIDFVPGLKGKSLLGIHDDQQWILERNQIDKLFKIMENFRNLLIIN